MDLATACQAFIASLGPTVPAAAHAVYGQTVVDRISGATSQVIRIHVRPEWRDRLSLPARFMGYQVVEDDWPRDPREVIGQLA